MTSECPEPDDASARCSSCCDELALPAPPPLALPAAPLPFAGGAAADVRELHKPHAATAAPATTSAAPAQMPPIAIAPSAPPLLAMAAAAASMLDWLGQGDELALTPPPPTAVRGGALLLAEGAMRGVPGLAPRDSVAVGVAVGVEEGVAVGVAEGDAAMSGKGADAVDKGSSALGVGSSLGSALNEGSSLCSSLGSVLGDGVKHALRVSQALRVSKALWVSQASNASSGNATPGAHGDAGARPPLLCAQKLPEASYPADPQSATIESTVFPRGGSVSPPRVHPAKAGTPHCRAFVVALTTPRFCPLCTVTRT